MNDSFEFAITGCGTAGIGLVLGWWCGLRFGLASRQLLNWTAGLLVTALFAALAWWMTARWTSGLILSISALVSLVFYFMWQQYLRKQLS